MRNILRQATASIFAIDWPQFEALAALRCSIGVAVPLLIGVAIVQPVVGVFGAAGAVGVGFGSFQGAYRSRAGLMLLAAAAMAFSVFIGSAAGHSNTATVAVAALWAFGGGLLVALGDGASFVGLQSIVALVIAGGHCSNVRGAERICRLASRGVWPRLPTGPEEARRNSRICTAGRGPTPKRLSSGCSWNRGRAMR